MFIDHEGKQYKAKYIKPYIQTTVSHDFSDKLKNLLNRHYDPTKPNVAL